jgi:hypothetical protein
MRPSASRRTLVLAALSLLVPRAASAYYPTCDEWVLYYDGKVDGSGAMCTIPNVPLYDQNDPNLAQQTESHYLALAGYSATYDTSGDQTSFSISFNNPSYGTAGSQPFIDVRPGDTCDGGPPVQLNEPFASVLMWPCVNCGESACTPAGCTNSNPDGPPGRAIQSICDLQPGDDVNLVNQLYSLFVS